jgi:hypothetical protein
MRHIGAVISFGFAPVSPHVAEAWRQRSRADVDASRSS